MRGRRWKALEGVGRRWKALEGGGRRWKARWKAVEGGGRRGGRRWEVVEGGRGRSKAHPAVEEDEVGGRARGDTRRADLRDRRRAERHARRAPLVLRGEGARGEIVGDRGELMWGDIGKCYESTDSSWEVMKARGRYGSSWEIWELMGDLHLSALDRLVLLLNG